MSKVSQGQSFINKVIEQTGSIEGLLSMALLNGLSVTDDVMIGSELKVPVVNNESVVKILAERQPANAQSLAVATPTYTGIGFMEIANNFIIG